MAGDKNPLKRQHPAVFPDKIPSDLIQVFCPENGIVLDPFMGSGSTAVMAKKHNRNFIGFEIKGVCRFGKQKIGNRNISNKNFI